MTKLSRREFFQAAATMAASAVLPKVEQSTEQAQIAEVDERVIEVNTGPEIANWDFESYHSVSFDFDLEQCIANLPGLRGFLPMPGLGSLEYGNFDVLGNGEFVGDPLRVTMGKVSEMLPCKYKAERMVQPRW